MKTFHTSKSSLCVTSKDVGFSHTYTHTHTLTKHTDTLTLTQTHTQTLSFTIMLCRMWPSPWCFDVSYQRWRRKYKCMFRISLWICVPSVSIWFYKVPSVLPLLLQLYSLALCEGIDIVVCSKSFDRGWLIWIFEIWLGYISWHCYYIIGTRTSAIHHNVIINSCMTLMTSMLMWPRQPIFIQTVPVGS